MDVKAYLQDEMVAVASVPPIVNTAEDLKEHPRPAAELLAMEMRQ